MIYVVEGLWKEVTVEIFRMEIHDESNLQFEHAILSKMKSKDEPQNGDLTISSFDGEFRHVLDGYEGGKLFQLLNLPHMEWSQEVVRDRYLLAIKGNRLGYSE
tara:strand:- start:20722 stop:21030 length:309 start_codon:yes stop_codon:yes gene_type:complete